jgi:spermidine/putrescine transport system ATP-binding protein
MSASVELDNLTVRFGSFTAVSRATLDIAGGEFFSFLGPSGCGKTTILRTVSGFLDPTEGAVRIGGQDMAGISPNRRPTALIFQNLALFPLMTVAENIAYGLRVRGVGKAERRRKADELLELIALRGQGDKLVSELSGGQKQRVAIARAIAGAPEVILADEPTAALDGRTGVGVAAALRDLARERGCAVVVVSHDPRMLPYADRVLTLEDGTITDDRPGGAGAN